MRFDLDEDDPAYGVLVIPAGGSTWWHVHLIRTNLRYYCELLGRPTSVLLSLQHFGRGGSVLELPFYLTLDGFGFELNPAFNAGGWYRDATSRTQRIAALRLATKIVDALNNSESICESIEYVMRHHQSEACADPASFETVGGDPLWE